MGKRDLTGLQSRRAAADERDRRCGVVRRAERWTADEPGGGQPYRRGGMDASGLQRLLTVEVGEHTGQAAGEHRLACARRADHEQVMATGGGDLEGLTG